MLTDLGDDLLLMLFENLRDYCPFTSLVSSRFCRLVTAVHFPYRRMASIGILMQREEAIACYLNDRRVVRMLRKSRSVDLQKWTSLAREMVVLHGSLDMIETVLGSPSSEAALQCARVDLLNRLNINNPTNILCDSLRFFAGSCDSNSNSNGYEICSHHANALIPACKAPSAASLQWIRSQVNAVCLTKNNNWAFVWSKLGGFSRRVVLAAASHGSEDTLDCILDLFFEHSPPDKILVFEGMCACVVSSMNRSLGAWQWLRKNITKRNQTLDGVLNRFVTAMRNRDQTHAVRNSYIADMNFVSATTFHVGDVQSYNIVTEGLQTGGWLRRAFFDACGHGTNFTSTCLFCNTNLWELSRLTNKRTDTERLIAQCTKDMAEDYVRFDGATRCFVIKALQVALDTSVEAAYDVTTYLAELKLGEGAQERRRNQLLYERHLLRVVLTNSVRMCRSGIVADIVTRTRLFDLKKIDSAQRLQLATCVSASSSRTSAMKMIVDCVVSFCPVDRDAVMQCIVRGNPVVFSALIQAVSTRVRLDIGRDVMEHSSAELLAAALEMQCFVRGSREETAALGRLRQLELGPSVTKHRRVITFDVISPRSAGNVCSM